MAKTMSKNTNTKKVTPTPAVATIAPAVEESVTIKPTVEETPAVVQSAPRKFVADALIRCVSITSGELIMVGEKTKTVYRWADNGDDQDVEYQDLIYATRGKSGFVFKPRFIIDNEEFLNQNPAVREKYETMYTFNDLQEVLALDPQSMKQTILSLPEGAKDSIKSMAATMIANGTLDSVTKIKILDEIFDTQLMSMTELL